MNATEIHCAVCEGELSPSASRKLIDALPPLDNRRWLTLMFGLMAAAFLILALVSFVASNWQGWDRLMRIGLASGLFALLCLPAILITKRLILRAIAQAIAFLAVGPLIALVGQTYQMGADAHGLFSAWAIFGFGFVIAGRNRWVWTLWLTVVGFWWVLFCGQVLNGLDAGVGGITLLGLGLLFYLPLAVNELRPVTHNWSTKLWRRIVILGCFAISTISFGALISLLGDEVSALLFLLVMLMGLALLYYLVRLRKIAHTDRIILAFCGLFAFSLGLMVVTRFSITVGIGGSALILLSTIGGLFLMVKWYRYEVGDQVTLRKPQTSEQSFDMGLTLVVIGGAILIGTAALGFVTTVMVLILPDVWNSQTAMIVFGLLLVAPLVAIRVFAVCAENTAHIAMIAVASAFACYGIILVGVGLFMDTDLLKSSGVLVAWIAFCLAIIAFGLWTAPHPVTKVVALGVPLIVLSVPLVILLPDSLSGWTALLIAFEALLSIAAWLFFTDQQRFALRDSSMLAAGLLLGLGGAWVGHSLLDVQVASCLFGVELSSAGRSWGLPCEDQNWLLGLWAIAPRILLLSFIIQRFWREPVCLAALASLALLGSLELAVAASLLLFTYDARRWGWLGLAAAGFLFSAVRFYFNADWTFLGSGALLALFAVIFAGLTLTQWRKPA